MLSLGLGLWSTTAVQGGGGGFPELLSNGTFDDTSVWTVVQGSITGGAWNSGSSATDFVMQPVTYVSGATYRFTCTYTMTSGAKIRVDQSATNGGAVPTGGVSPTLSTSGGTVTLDFTATVSGSNWLHIEADTAGFIGTIDNCSLKRTS